jgi:BRCA1-associated protein
MDESVSTVMTILCNHKFHSGCLAQWEDPTCPVCRYVQTPEVVTEHLCLDCQSAADLWICLVCGYVGCGRYAGGHAHQHFLDTQHCYSMELGHNRVWDYVGDAFVHRLVQSQEDGKLVEQEGGGLRGGKGGAVDGLAVDSEEKMDSLQLEYTYLLTSQLEDQRSYFQSKVARVEEEAGREVAAVTDRMQQQLEGNVRLQENLDTAVKERARSEVKVGQLGARVAKLAGELEEERQLNLSLRENQEEWQTRLRRAEVEVGVIKNTKDTEIQELKEQVRDLMFFMEAQSQVKESPLKDEIESGSVTVGEAPPPAAGARGGRRGRRGK